MNKHEKEMRTVYEMIHLYCKKNHKKKELCPECLALYEYARMRIEKMSVNGNKDVLFAMQGALLQEG